MAVIKLQGEQEKKQGCRYEFDDQANIIGEGGMGVVYLGKRIDHNGAEIPVAIKELKIKDPEVIERARREAAIQLNNDHLVRMYGMIEVEHNDALRTTGYYVISEYVEGVMLDSVLDGNLKNREGKVFPKIQEFYDAYNNDRNQTATRVVKSILSGVMALHDAGYIHRDIDPTNIMVTSAGKVKLIDFGIAKKMASIQSQKSELTTPGQFIGKAEYAAPELILGDTRHQNYHTDIYAIGILYYQLVVGHVPFEGSKYDVIECQLRKKLPLGKISSRQIREIIRTATEKKQGDRYASSALFRAAIDNITYPEPKHFPIKAIGMTLGGIAIGVLLFFALRGLGGGTAAGDGSDTLTVEQKQFNACLANLNTSVEDSIKNGFEGMLELAESGYADAMYEVGYTLAPTLPDDKLNNTARKRALGLEDNEESAREHNKMKEWRKQKDQAEVWLYKNIEATDSANYKALFVMTTIAFYDNKMDEIVKLCHTGLRKAQEAGDEEYAERIENLLDALK